MKGFWSRDDGFGSAWLSAMKGTNIFLQDRLDKVKQNLSLPHSGIRFALIRFAVYGFTLLTGEIAFYSIIKMMKASPLSYIILFDWKVDPKLGLDGIYNAPNIALFGMASIWMLLVYACAALIWCETIFRHFYTKPFYIRGPLYALGITLFEGITGKLLYNVTGYKIWYYADPFAIGEFTSLAIAPLWALLGLFAFEPVYAFLMDEVTRRKLLQEIHDRMYHDLNTGLHNETYLKERFESLSKFHIRKRRSLIVCRITGNDLGLIVTKVKNVLLGNLRSEDIVAIAHESVFILFPETKKSSIANLKKKLEGYMELSVSIQMKHLSSRELVDRRNVQTLFD